MKSLGNFGENLALKYLTDKGYLLVERNFKYKRNEIDLIVKKDNCLIFVEVKFRSSKEYGQAEEFVSEAQALRIQEAAEEFMININWSGQIQFDIIAIYQEKKINTQHSSSNNPPRIFHFKDAF